MTSKGYSTNAGMTMRIRCANNSGLMRLEVIVCSSDRQLSIVLTGDGTRFADPSENQEFPPDSRNVDQCLRLGRPSAMPVGLGLIAQFVTSDLLIIGGLAEAQEARRLQMVALGGG